MRDNYWDRILLLMRWLVAIIFIFAGITKLSHPDAFARAIDNYRILPYLPVTLLAIVLPWLEIFGGMFLIIGKWQRGAALTLLMLTFMFLIAISSAMLRGLDISCGCFSTSMEGTKIGYTRLIEDIVLFCAMLFINFRQSNT